MLIFCVLKCFLKEVQVKAYRSQSWNCTQSYICQSKCGLAKWVEELTRIWQEIKHKWTQGWFACWMSVTIISLKGIKTFYFCWRSICLHLLTNVYFCFELLFFKVFMKTVQAEDLSVTQLTAHSSLHFVHFCCNFKKISTEKTNMMSDWHIYKENHLKCVYICLHFYFVK